MAKGWIYIIGMGVVCAIGGFAQAKSSVYGKPFVIKIDSVTGALGHLVSVPIQITNPTAVGILDLRLQYGSFSESLHSVTPAARVAGWEYPPMAEADTSAGEIHIVGIADVPPNGSASWLQPGSGEVAYLNFKVYDDSAFNKAFLRIFFVFNDSTDNVLFDSSGNRVDSSQIEYVEGGINLRATDVWEREHLPRAFQLSQNYPNPFNPQTQIDFYLPVSGKAWLVVYDVLGRRVRPLVNEFLPAGPHSAVWDGRDFNGRPAGSGMYFYEMVFGDRRQAKKMILVK
jgi:hypothetical protein